MAVYAGPADFWTDGTDAGRIHIATKGIIQSGLVLNLDAGASTSYPGSGTTWTNLSNNTNNGTLTNSPTFDSGKGGAIVFDGVNDYCDIGNISLTYYTISVWFRTNGLPTNDDSVGGAILTQSRDISHGIFLAHSFSSRRIFFSHAFAQDFGTNNNSVMNYALYNVVATYNGSKQSIYINGALNAERNWTSALDVGGTPSFQIGRWGYPGFSRQYQGNIYALSIYNRALSAAEVAHNYNASVRRFISIDDLNIVSNGLLMHLDAGNSSSYPGSGTTWTDLSGNGNNGTLTNGPTYSSANGGAIVFDGVNDYIVSTSAASNYTANMTAEAWIKVNNLSNDWVRIVGVGSQNFGLDIRTFGLWYNTTGNLLWQRYGGQDPNLYTNAFSLATNTWYHIVATTSGSTHTIYVNGTIMGSATASGPWTASPSNITIGYGTIHLYTNSNISAVRLYNRALSVFEVVQNFNATRGRFGI